LSAIDQLTFIHVLELMLAAAAIGFVVDRFRALLFIAPVDTAPYLAAVGHALADGDLDEARDLARRGSPGWVPAVLELGLGDGDGSDDEADTESGEGDHDLFEQVAEFRYLASRRIYPIRVFASLGTALGMLGALKELIWMFSGDHGLLALKAGLVESIAMQRAILAMALGIAISIFSLVALQIVKRAAMALMRDIAQANDLLDKHGYGSLTDDLADD